MSREGEKQWNCLFQILNVFVHGLCHSFGVGNSLHHSSGPVDHIAGGEDPRTAGSAHIVHSEQQYREQEVQAAEFDAEEPEDARLELRPGMDRSTVSRIQTAYDTLYSPFTMAEARRDVSNMLDEHDQEPRSVRERLRKHQQEQTALHKKEKGRDR